MSGNTILSNLPADTPIKELAGAIKARWICEQAHQQLKEEGLALTTSKPFLDWSPSPRAHDNDSLTAFLAGPRRLAQAGRKKKRNRRTAASAQPAGSPASHP